MNVSWSTIDSMDRYNFFPMKRSSNGARVATSAILPYPVFSFYTGDDPRVETRHEVLGRTSRKEFLVHGLNVI